ncbi:MAG: hypothetical protein HY306_07470 [Nitrosomonadales bacterium]|nr:hypothetical protein [Nitrosomonadales bacterium]
MNRLSAQSGNIAKLFLFLVLSVDLYTVLGIDRHYHPYIAGDWLINYQGGFIRRGLVGEIIFQVTQLVGISPWIWVFAIQAVLYAGITLLVLQKLRASINIIGWLFLISPLAFLFEVYDPGGLGRKELLFLFLLGLNGYILETRPEKVGSALYLFVLAAAMSCAILIHESALFYFPILLLQLSVYGKCAYKKLLVPIAIIALVAGSVLANKGSLQQVTSILESWLPYANILLAACNKLDYGAICYLKTSTEEAIHLTMSPGYIQMALMHFMIVLAYGILFIFALRPIVSETDRSRVLFNLALAMLLLSPLYFLGVDYGRWTHVFVMGLFLSLPGRALSRAIVLNADARLNKISIVLLVLLSLSWNVVHTRSEIPGAGIWGYRADFLNSRPFKS